MLCYVMVPLVQQPLVAPDIMMKGCLTTLCHTPDITVGGVMFDLQQNLVEVEGESLDSAVRVFRQAAYHLHYDFLQRHIGYLGQDHQRVEQ